MGVVRSLGNVGEFLIGIREVNAVTSMYYGLEVSGLEYTITFSRTSAKAFATIFVPVWCVMLLSCLFIWVSLCELSCLLGCLMFLLF